MGKRLVLKGEAWNMGVDMEISRTGTVAVIDVWLSDRVFFLKKLVFVFKYLFFSKKILLASFETDMAKFKEAVSGVAK